MRRRPNARMTMLMRVSTAGIYTANGEQVNIAKDGECNGDITPSGEHCALTG
jgi:hypothetical protein